MEKPDSKSYADANSHPDAEPNSYCHALGKSGAFFFAR
jgi:hypothetical protein